MKHTTIGLTALLGFALASQSLLADAERRLRDVPAAECGECHQQIYQQWKGSMHAQSSALSDPIHGAFYRSVMGDPKQEGLRKKGKYPVCLQCHAPNAAKDAKTDLSANPLYDEGISCTVCHSLTVFKGTKNPQGGLRLGMQAYEFSDTHLQGPTGRDIHPMVDKSGRKGPVFPVQGNAAILKTNAVCMGCHDQRKNSNKVPLCQTGDEIAHSETSDCQLCHMPVIGGKADHSLMGGHSPKMVAKGLMMTMNTSASNDMLRIDITLRNKLPHKFPTGAPFRNVFVVVTAYDRADREIWRSSSAHPIKDDKQAVLMYALGGDDDKPAPPPKATKVLFDSRLKPHESRQLSYQLTLKEAARIKAEAYYDLLLPPLKKKFEQQVPADLRQSQLIATAEAAL